ncbi:MAG: DUF6057 family protein [Prevotella sp.]
MRKKPYTTPLPVMLVCAGVFYIFTFLFIYIYQTATLTFAQHILSDGVTFYRPFVSTMLICIACGTIQQLVHHTTSLRPELHALSYALPFLALAVMTSLGPDGEGGISMHRWTQWLPVVIIILLAFVIKVQRNLIAPPQQQTGLATSRTLSSNLIIMTLMMALTANAANGDETLHRQMRAERMMLSSQYDGIIAAERSNALYRTFPSDYQKGHVPYLSTDTTLTLIRYIALDKRHLLADSLFTQPVAASSASLFGLHGVSPLLFKPGFLRRTKSTDYMLCSMLADCDLDRFARHVSRIYALDTIPPDSIPRHYREAIVLYCHTRSNPIIHSRDSVMEADYRDMRNMMRDTPDKAQRRHTLWLYYRNTYWHYYLTHSEGV